MVFERWPSNPFASLKELVRGRSGLWIPPETGETREFLTPVGMKTWSEYLQQPVREMSWFDDFALIGWLDCLTVNPSLHTPQRP